MDLLVGSMFAIKKSPYIATRIWGNDMKPSRMVHLRLHTSQPIIRFTNTQNQTNPVRFGQEENAAVISALSCNLQSAVLSITRSTEMLAVKNVACCLIMDLRFTCFGYWPTTKTAYNI
jgi:hypothetical protein